MSSACGKFQSVVVQSGYKLGEFFVSWTLKDPALIAGEAYVYRSFDGSNWGDPLNLKTPVVGSTFYQDVNVRSPSNDDPLFYRITIYFNGEYFDSPIGGLYREDMNAKEQGIVRRILNLEMKEMRYARNGYRALLFKPLLRGRPCPDCQNVATGTPTQATLCPTCYGTRIVGGYADPVQTWIRRMDNKTMDRKDLAGGAGTTDQDTATFRGLAFPLLRLGDMLVVPADDTRWVVGRVELSLFRGIIPISANFLAANIVQGDIRQTIPADF